MSILILRGFPGGVSGKELDCKCRRCKRCRFNLWILKIPWRRARQPMLPVFLPGEPHGQRSLADYGPRGRRESDAPEAPGPTGTVRVRLLAVVSKAAVDIHSRALCEHGFYSSGVSARGALARPCGSCVFGVLKSHNATFQSGCAIFCPPTVDE